MNVALRSRLAVAVLVVTCVASVYAAVRTTRSRNRAQPVPRVVPPGYSVVPSSLPVAPRLPVPAPAASARVAPGPPTTLHLDAARTNRSPFVGPSTPSVSWTFDAGAPIEGSPVLLADGTIIVSTLGGLMIGVSPQGRQLFASQLQGRGYATPLVTTSSILIGSDAKRFFAFDLKGSPRWQMETDGEADTSAVLAPWGGVVFAAGPTIYAVKPGGGVLWRVKTKRKVFASPSIGDDGTVYVGGQDNRLYAIDSGGHIRFALNLGADVDCAAAVGDDRTIYVGVDGGAVVAIDPIGKVKWRASLGGHVRGGLTLTRNGGVVAGVYGPSPRVVWIDAGSGQERWSFSVPGTGAIEYGVHGSPVEDAAGNLFFGAQDDAVYALTRDGSLLWRLATAGDVDAAIVIGSHRTLYAASDDGKLYAITQSGAP